jgi:hypothetical protein
MQRLEVSGAVRYIYIYIYIYVIRLLKVNSRVMLVKVFNVVIFQGVQFSSVQYCADRIIAHQSGT